MLLDILLFFLGLFLFLWSGWISWGKITGYFWGALFCVAGFLLYTGWKSGEYKSTFEVKTVASYSNGTDGGVIYKLKGKTSYYEYLYATPSTNFVLAGYGKIAFCYAEDSTVVLCAMSGNKLEWYDLRGKFLKCNYAFVSDELYKELWEINPKLRNKSGLMYIPTSFPEEISAEKLERISAKNVVLPKKGDIYKCAKDWLEKSTLEKLGYRPSWQFNFLLICTLLTFPIFVYYLVVNSSCYDAYGDLAPGVVEEPKVGIPGYVAMLILLIGIFVWFL